MKGVRAYATTNMLQDKNHNPTTYSPLDPIPSVPSGPSVHTISQMEDFTP